MEERVKMDISIPYYEDVTRLNLQPSGVNIRYYVEHLI